MALNLIRNARMFFTTNVNATTGVVATTGFDATNTREIQVLDGLSFSQATGSETVTVNEAGTSPVRGQRLFNTSLDPVEISFSTYMRPYFNAGGAGTTDDQIDCEEDVLWNAFATGAGNSDAWAVTAGASPVSKMTMAQSGKNQLKTFGIIVVLDQTSYIIDNCALDQATIDFGLDAISTIAWTARGTVMRNIGDSTVLAADKPAAGTDITFSGSYFTTTAPATDNAKNKNTNAAFLANKLSSVALSSISVGGVYGGGASTTYQLALTGGSITLANNITYLTPANLGVVNTPITYFTGTRAVSGTLNCYLKTGSATDSGKLLDNMLDNSSNVEPAFSLTVHIGGGSTTKPRVSLVMPSVVLQIPTINTEQVVSTAINFTAQGLTSGAFDLEAKNEIEVQYYAQ
jgi:hypothetical protein